MIKLFFQKLWRLFLNWWRPRQLLVNDKLHDEAQEAVNRVVYETSIPPDCVSAGVYDGGFCISVKHNDAWEMFIHNSHREAADEAIAWVKLQGDELAYNKKTKLNRATRRAFDSYREKHSPQQKQKHSKNRGRHLSRRK